MIVESRNQRLVTAGDLHAWLVHQHAYAPRLRWVLPEPTWQQRRFGGDYVLRPETETESPQAKVSFPLAEHLLSRWQTGCDRQVLPLRPAEIAGRIGLLKGRRARAAWEETARWHRALDEGATAWDAWLLRCFGVHPMISATGRLEQVLRDGVRARLILNDLEAEAVAEAVVRNRPPTLSALADRWLATTAERTLDPTAGQVYSEHMGTCFDCGCEFRLPVHTAEVFWATGAASFTDNPAGGLHECYECSSGQRSAGEKRPMQSTASACGPAEKSIH